LQYHQEFEDAIEEVGSLAIDKEGWRSCILKKGYKSIIDVPLLSARFDDTKYRACLFEGQHTAQFFEVELTSADASVQFVLYNPIEDQVIVTYDIYFDIGANDRFFICQNKRDCLLAREMSLSDQYEIPTGVKQVVWRLNLQHHPRIYGAAITTNASGPRECGDGGGSDWEAEFYEEDDWRGIGHKVYPYLCNEA